jgi:hypothetical protein
LPGLGNIAAPKLPLPAQSQQWAERSGFWIALSLSATLFCGWGAGVVKRSAQRTSLRKEGVFYENKGFQLIFCNFSSYILVEISDLGCSPQKLPETLARSSKAVENRGKPVENLWGSVENLGKFLGKPCGKL